MFRSILAHPLTKGLSVDDPMTTDLRRRIIAEKPFLKNVYREWYQLVLDRLPQSSEAVLELGSGAGFLSDYIPDLITSEVFPCEEVSTVLDARQMPFPNDSLRAIVMTDVLHHIPDVERFFAEAQRTLVESGRIVMIEPWSTNWSRFVYTHLHHEPFRPDAEDWTFPRSGPLSGANGAIPWMVFVRDRALFESRFPNLQVDEISLFMPFRYLVSGGVSLRGLMPGWSFGAWRRFEALLGPAMGKLAMFALIVVKHDKR